MPATVYNNSKFAGDEGEQKAASFLQSQGYRILERNWRYKKYEIDIIAQKDETLVFVEVKTRKNGTFGEPESFVSKKQQGYLVAAADFFVQDKDLNLECRFDVIAISDLQDSDGLRHIEGAFFPTAR